MKFVLTWSKVGRELIENAWNLSYVIIYIWNLSFSVGRSGHNPSLIATVKASGGSNSLNHWLVGFQQFKGAEFRTKAGGRGSRFESHRLHVLMMKKPHLLRSNLIFIFDFHFFD